MKLNNLYKNKIGISILILLAISSIFLLSYNEIIYGKSTNIIKEINSSKSNPIVTKDKDSLRVALSLQKAIRNVAKSISPTVVNIRTELNLKGRKSNNFFRFFNRGQKLQHLGSGFIISKKGYIITNNHVVKNADQITVLFSDEKEYVGKVIGKDSRTDIAVIKINANEDLPVAPLGNSDNVRIGDFAIAIGNPFGLKGSVTFGVISAIGRDNIDLNAGLKNYIQTDASINRGNSGGPLLNIHGQVIGMNTAIYSTTGGSVGIGFAIPANIIKRIVSSLIKKGFVERGYLGVTIAPIPKNIAKYLKIKKKSGIFVNDVMPDGPAYKAGIKAGDVILEVDGKKITSVSHLQRVISLKKRGQRVNIKLFRKNKVITKKVIIGKLKSDPIARNGKESKKKSSNFMGITVGPIKNHYKKFRLSKKIKGVVIINIENNSTAYKANIRAGDVIQFINYEYINSVKGFNKFINKNKKKKKFLIQLKRGKQNYFALLENK